MAYHIRAIKEDEYALLEDFLYEAIFVPSGMNPPPRSIIEAEALQVYIRNFGMEKDDQCFVAVVDEKVVGAVWVRIMNDYGAIDADTPSLAMSVYKTYRRAGIGTTLLKHMLKDLSDNGYKQCSLSVQKQNFAVQMYLNIGFEVVSENEEEYIMACKLN